MHEFVTAAENFRRFVRWDLPLQKLYGLFTDGLYLVRSPLILSFFILSIIKSQAYPNVFPRTFLFLKLGIAFVSSSV